MPRSLLDREAIEAEIDRIRSLGLDELRSLWRATFRTAPPPPRISTSGAWATSSPTATMLSAGGMAGGRGHGARPGLRRPADGCAPGEFGTQDARHRNHGLSHQGRQDR